MKFSKDVPTVNGYYWFKGPCGFMAAYQVLFIPEEQNNLNPTGMMVLDSPIGYKRICLWVYNQYEFAPATLDNLN